MEFEDILQQTGGCGWFQRNLTILFIIPIYCIIPWFWLNKIFMLSVPQHWCNIPELQFSNLSIDEQRTFISPPNDPSCFMYNINYTSLMRKGIFKAPNDSEITPCIHGWQYDAEHYDYTAAMKWDMVCDYSYLPSLTFTLANVGSLIGTPVYGFLSDKFGRKIVFLFLAALVVITEIASVLVNDFVVFTIMRIINGSVLPVMFTLPYIITTELVPPRMRAHLSGVINTSFTLGLCILPLVAYFSRNWVTMGYITAAAAAFILCYWRYIPESPSWLISQDKFDDAMQILMKIGKKNGKSQNHPEMLLQLQTLRGKIKKREEEEKNSSQNVILRYPRLRRNFLVLSFCWMTFNVTYGGLTYNMVNLNGNEFLNFFLISVVEFPGNLIFWLLMNNIGRRWTTTFGFLMTGLSCLLPVIDFKNSDIVSSMMGKLISTGFIMVTDQQGMELFPTVARSFGMGAGKTVAQLMSLFVPFIAYLNLYGQAVPFIAISLTCFTACVLSSFLPESLNENLPQSISDAEEFGRDQKYFSWNRRNSNVKTKKPLITEREVKIQEEEEIK